MYVFVRLPQEYKDDSLRLFVRGWPCVFLTRAPTSLIMSSPKPTKMDKTQLISVKRKCINAETARLKMDFDQAMEKLKRDATQPNADPQIAKAYNRMTTNDQFPR